MGEIQADDVVLELGANRSAFEKQQNADTLN